MGLSRSEGRKSRVLRGKHASRHSLCMIREHMISKFVVESIKSFPNGRELELCLVIDGLANLFCGHLHMVVKLAAILWLVNVTRMHAMHN